MSPDHPVYLDSSAAVKLALQEAESEALRGFLLDHPLQMSSRIVEVELPRALARSGVTNWPAATRWILDSVALIDLGPAIREAAGAIGPVNLRSLDAIHLATALSIPGLAGMVVYDHRLAEAARGHGLRVFSPGR